MKATKEGLENIRRPGERGDPVSCNSLKTLDDQPAAVEKHFRLDQSVRLLKPPE
jgi:hypothetical protein